jgi:hypothetical protein
MIDRILCIEIYTDCPAIDAQSVPKPAGKYSYASGDELVLEHTNNHGKESSHWWLFDSSGIKEYLECDIVDNNREDGSRDSVPAKHYLRK